MKDKDIPEDAPHQAAGNPAERSAVGYKRPPLEHRFKKGQKPPPRKKKDPQGAVPMSETLRKVLGEERRVALAGKPRWVTVADLVIRRAWLEAEKGSATLRREMFRLSFSFEGPALEQAPLVITDPSAPGSATEFRLMPIDEAPT